MRLPIRKSNKLKKPGSNVIYLTQEGIDKLQNTLKKLEKDLPQAIEDVRTTGEFGDFSENAEYQEAKARMRRTRNKIMSINEKLKIVVLIEEDQETGQVKMGSVVEVLVADKEKTFKLVGPYEADPVSGKISYLSPIGMRLMNKTKGESFNIKLQDGEEVVYKIINIK